MSLARILLPEPIVVAGAALVRLLSVHEHGAHGLLHGCRGAELHVRQDGVYLLDHALGAQDPTHLMGTEMVTREKKTVGIHAGVDQGTTGRFRAVDQGNRTAYDVLRGQGHRGTTERLRAQRAVDWMALIQLSLHCWDVLTIKIYHSRIVSSSRDASFEKRSTMNRNITSLSLSFSHAQKPSS